MTVKSVRGRRRYTSFEVPAGIGRHAAEQAVSSIASAKVITCIDGLAVIRSLPEDREALADSISAAFPGSRSLDCSGTLRALRKGPAAHRPPQTQETSGLPRTSGPNPIYRAPFGSR